MSIEPSQRTQQSRWYLLQMLAMGVSMMLVVFGTVWIWRASRNETTRRRDECVIELTKRLHHHELEGMNAADIRKCLNLANSLIRLPTGEMEYRFDNHPTEANQEGPASLSVILDAGGKKVKEAKLLFYDW